MKYSNCKKKEKNSDHVFFFYFVLFSFWGRIRNKHEVSTFINLKTTDLIFCLNIWVQFGLGVLLLSMELCRFPLIIALLCAVCTGMLINEWIIGLKKDD